jgi:peroxiredoxin
MLELIDSKKAIPANDFTATDSENRSIKLSDYRGKKNVVLVFNRGFF